MTIEHQGFEPTEIKDSTPISEILPIEESGGFSIRTRSDIETIVEYPLVEACQILYDKNIQTTYSSANKKDLEGENPKAFIAINYEMLSEENKRIAEGIGEVSDGGILKIFIPMGATTTVGDIKKSAKDIVERLVIQPVAPRYILSEVMQKYGMSENQAITELTGSGLYYDGNGNFYSSEEQFRKSKIQV